MVIQAIALLDDLDKEINMYSMRVKVAIRFPSTSHVVLLSFFRNGMGGTSPR